MPTYLTPGVYVEEVPSASKPIEGVGTSIAAFVGLAPGGPVNTPMRISNWTQFAKIFGDPNEPENGPFMDGAYLAHSVYGFFQNGGALCWIVDVGTGGKEEFDGLTVKKGRQNIATKVNAQSKLIGIEDLSASLPEAQRAPATGSYTLSTPAAAPEKVEASDFEGDVARRKGMGGLAAVDEVTMVCMPDIMTLADSGGDDVQMRDLQGKMIAHCEMAGDRMAILDAPPDMLPQDILEWRMNTAGYDSKFATLYYPW